MKIYFENFILFLTKKLLKLWLKMTGKDPDGCIYKTIDDLVEEEDEGGSPLDSDERLLLGNVLDLKDKPISEIMIARAQILAVPIETPVVDMVKLMHKKRMSRLLIYKNNLDNLLGYVSVKDIALYMSDASKTFEIKDNLHKIHFVSPTMRMLDLLIEMRESGKKMAAVVDEHGGIDGLVIFGDLIEEIIGEIRESDLINPPGRINIKENGDIEVDGHTKLCDLEEKVDMVFEEDSDDVTTISGLVASAAGCVPSRGEVIEYKPGISFVVLEASPRKVKRVCIKIAKS